MRGRKNGGVWDGKREKWWVWMFWGLRVCVEERVLCLEGDLLGSWERLWL